MATRLPKVSATHPGNSGVSSMLRIEITWLSRQSMPSARAERITATFLSKVPPRPVIFSTRSGKRVCIETTIWFGSSSSPEGSRNCSQ